MSIDLIIFCQSLFLLLVTLSSYPNTIFSGFKIREVQWCLSKQEVWSRTFLYSPIVLSRHDGLASSFSWALVSPHLSYWSRIGHTTKCLSVFGIHLPREIILPAHWASWSQIWFLGGWKGQTRDRLLSRPSLSDVAISRRGKQAGRVKRQDHSKSAPW